MTKAIAFDAYGTLLDVGSVASVLGHLDPASRERFVVVWRSKQLEYSWLRTIMGRYENFERVSGDALKYAIRAVGLNESRFESMMAEMRKLKCFPEVPSALKQLGGHSVRMVVLSNGTEGMLDDVLKANGVRDEFEAIISVERVRAYKPAPAVYGLAGRHFSLAPADILFVSSNSWDVAGAASFGLRTAWCNRAKHSFDELGFKPDLEVSNLVELAEAVKSGR